MSILKRLFGRAGDKAPAEQPSETYKGFTITPQPAKDGGQFRIGALIEKDVGGTTRSHHLIRADRLESFEAAAQASLAKARQMIDEQGERLFSD